MYNQRESGWADGQLNINHERTDDLDGAAEGDNETSRISVQNQTAPSRPRSRDSYYDRDREIRDRGEPDYYGSSRSRNHGHTTEPRRRRNDSYRESIDRDRMADFDYEYGRRDRDSRRSRQIPDRRYPESYYGGSGYSRDSGRGNGYGAQPPGWMMNAREILERLRVQDPLRYREWYNQYQAHRLNPTQVPNPGLPSFGPSNASATPISSYGPPFNNGPSSNRTMYDSGIERPPNSGRSSVNDELMNLSLKGLAYMPPSVNQTPSIVQDMDAGFRPIPNDHRYRETPEPEHKRMTPLKFNTSHCFGVLTPLGHLIKVKNQGSTLEVIPIKSLLNHLPDFKEVDAFRGPLVKGTTHKDTVIQFCQKKIKEAQHNEAQVDKENFILLWELLIMLLRQNGIVVGSDVAVLLLKSQSSSSEEASSAEEYQSKESSSDEDSSNNKSVINKSVPFPVNEAKVTEKFCELLLYGHKKGAIDYAIENGLWGHALFLASKIDERTYSSVMAKFANCTAFNHPLQTFYQIMSGKQPASAKSCCDDSFGDWKPHLSMILSNAGSRPDVEFKSIVKMGDTLGKKNFIFAAQFCYLMGQADFSPESKLGPLLGLNPSAGNIIEATQMTEIYEFARSLAEPTYTLGPSFIQSKLNYVKTLLDFGFVEDAFVYCEEITKKLKYLNLKRNEENIDVLKWSILQIAERLVRCEESETGEDPVWIQELRSELANPVTESMSDNLSERRDSVSDNKFREPHDDDQGNLNVLQEQPPSDQIPYVPTYVQEQPLYNPDPNQLYGGMNNTQSPHYESAPQVYNAGQYQNQQSLNQPPINNDLQIQPSQGTSDQSFQPQQPPQYGINPDPGYNSQPQNPGPQPWNPSYQPPVNQVSGPLTDSHNNPPPSFSGYPNQNYSATGGGYSMPESSYGPPPLVADGSMGPTVGANKGYDPMQQPLPPMKMNNQQPLPPQPSQTGDKSLGANQQKPPKGQKPNKGSEANKKPQPSWFGGLIGKLVKGPNQMILPDDKDPTMVWDSNLNKWVNTKGDEDEDSGPKGPPPTDSQLMGGQGPPPMMQQPIPTQPYNQFNGLPPGPPSFIPQQPMLPQQPYPTNSAPPARPESLPSASMAPNMLSYAPQPTPQQPENNNNNYLQHSPTNNYQPQNPNLSFSTAPSNNTIPDVYNSGPSLNGPTPALNLNNKYKLAKTRNRYVDVLNPNSNATAPNTNQMGNGGVGGNSIGPAGGAPVVPNMFIPSPIMGSGDSGPVSFLTPAPAGLLPAQIAQIEAEPK